MQPKIVVRDALIIFALTFIGGFAIGLARPLFAIPDEGYLILITAANFVFSTVGFTISATRTPRHRWKHILLVALCVWPMGLVNVFFGVTLVQWFFGILFLVITMAFGGTLSYIFSGTSAPNSSNDGPNNCVNRSGESGGI